MESVAPDLHLIYYQALYNPTLSILQTGSSRSNSMKCQESVSGPGLYHHWTVYRKVEAKNGRTGGSSAQDGNNVMQGLKRKNVIPVVSPNVNVYVDNKSPWSKSHFSTSH